MDTILLTKGDSIKWRINYKNSDNTPVDLTGFSVNVDAVNRETKMKIFKVDSSTPTSNAYITTSDFNIGEFDLIIKDTDTYPLGVYYINVQYVDQEGIKVSSKRITLKIVDFIQ